MAKLTKEQKMDMLSGLPVRFHGAKEKESARANVNAKSHGNEGDRFEIVIFLK